MSMVDARPDLLVVGPPRQAVVEALERAFTVHRMSQAEDVAGRVRAIAMLHPPDGGVDAKFMRQFPKLQIVSSFGVGYDHIDAKWAGANGIIITNTPDVLNEEVADTTLGLLLCTVRELPQAMSYLQAGKWEEGPYPLTRSTLRDRTVGLVGMGRIGRAIARRLDAFGVPVVYHSRRRNAEVTYKYYPQLLDMARDVDTLVVIIPGGPDTRRLINGAVLEALGPRGILINVARGSVVDEPALIAALRDRKIQSAGLDVFANEPHVPKELLAMPNVVLLPHVGSAAEYTRAAMDQLVVDNLLSWAGGSGALTPVAETLGVAGK